MLARVRTSMEEKDQGFTLIELLVVMIIIGILAAIAVPVFLNQRQKAVDSSIKSDIRTVATTVETAFVDSQSYPVTSGSAYVDVSATGQTVLVGLGKLTNGNKIEYKPVTDGFCIRGSSANATAKGGTAGTFYIYDSKLGGQQPAAAASSTNC
ncbi:type II secretion system protein [Quadrisphaera sp. DSM 44207]|uniref:type II secretion system protein n=1 Tax=Quadrisphaera sp. DSM 44207 TaxID=1881057 RepID=UPI0008835605|nr:type II secretion system protein [Quadrisphaera sp. DSM 44207]SDQ46796.1 type II secretion system protein G [Quadrisphaera sp. DSM 44207]